MRIRNRLIAGIVVLSALFAFDLANRGVFWQFAWAVTGEETPLAQLRGVSEWLVSYTRPQPRTAPMTPIQHTNVNPYGINTFFQLEVEPEKIEAQMQMIADAGFKWVRQQFQWAEIEVDGRGQFTDSRNDMDGDGKPDTIDAWAKFDRIVDLTERYGLQIQARLDDPPAWSQSDPSPENSFAPPDDFEDYVNFAVAVAERYQGRIHHYQIWNEPNIFPEWGDNPVNPEAYTELLCRTYQALKAVDPEIIVITASFAPTVSLTGRDLNEFVYIQRMYNAGAGDCFDVMSVQGYGLNSGPTDRRMRPTTVTAARNLYIRDLMVVHGDAHKPIWISEAAWNYVPTFEENPAIEGIREAYGQVSPQQAADYMPQLYQRAQTEWPWIGVINYWFFTRPDPSERNRPEYYFRMVEPDFDPENDPPFEPMPIYEAMRDHILSEQPTLYQGVHQIEDHWAVELSEASEIVPDDQAQFAEALRTDLVRFSAAGTDVSILWKGTSLEVIDDRGTRTFALANQQSNGVSDNWSRIQLHSSLLPESSLYTIIATGDEFLVDSISISDRTYENLAPLFAIGATTLLMLVIAIGNGIQLRFG